MNNMNVHVAGYVGTGIDPLEQADTAGGDIRLPLSAARDDTSAADQPDTLETRVGKKAARQSARAADREAEQKARKKAKKKAKRLAEREAAACAVVDRQVTESGAGAPVASGAPSGVGPTDRAGDDGSVRSEAPTTVGGQNEMSADEEDGEVDPLADNFVSTGVPGSVSGDDFFGRRVRPSSESLLGSRSRIAPTRALGLFVVRESDEWDRILFDAMRDRTYLPHRSVPEVEAVRRAGMVPFTHESFWIELPLVDGTTRRTQVFVESVGPERLKAVLFSFGGYWHLWCQASAAKVTDDSGVNDFTATLVDVIRRLRPKTVYAANFSRLVRSMRQAHKLADVFTECVDEVWVGEFRFSFDGANSVVGDMMLAMLSWAAAMERDAIVTRLLAGRIAKWRRGEWPYGATTVPFGFKVDKKRRLVPDLDKRAIVRQMMIIMASDLQPAEMAAQLGEAGVTAMRKHRRLDDYTPIGALAAKSQAIRTLWAWAGLYISGEYLMRFGSSFPGLDEIAGVPIMRYLLDDEDSDGIVADPNDLGELQMLCKVPVPKGGWAEPEIVAAFAAAALRHSERLLGRGRTPNRPVADSVIEESSDGGLLNGLLPALAAAGADRASQARRDRNTAHAHVSPLTGRGWTDGTYYYEMQTVTTGTLRMSRWPIADCINVDGVFRVPVSDPEPFNLTPATASDPATDADEDTGTRATGKEPLP